MTVGRIAAAWIAVAGAIVGFVGVMVHSTGILVRHGAQPSEILHGWDAVQYLCPRVALGLVAFTAVAGVVAWLLDGRPRRPAIPAPVGGQSQPCGPVEDWPWGQKPGTWMLDPAGHLAGPLGNPEGWIAAHRGNIDAAKKSGPTV
jgi:hypothetical protein